MPNPKEKDIFNYDKNNKRIKPRRPKNDEVVIEDIVGYRGYNGNKLIKGVNVDINWTPAMVKEYIKCSQDIIYFVEKYVKIVSVDKGIVPFKLHDYQKELLLSMHDDAKVVALAARQSGKTSCARAFILHYVIFNSTKTVALLANKGDTAREILGGIQNAFQFLPKWMTPGVVEFNKGTILLENGSRILAAATSSNNIRGYAINCTGPNTKITVKDKETGFINTLTMDELERQLLGRNMTYGFVYITTNKINGKKYIGAHRNKTQDNYLGSGKTFLKALKKYGKENFIQEIIEFAEDENELFELEKKLIEKYNAVKDNNFYNIISGGRNCVLSGEENGFYGKTHSDETKEKISKIHKGKTLSEERKLKIKEESLKRWSDPVFREKMKTRKSRSFTEEQKQKHSEKLKGKKLSDETKQKLSKAKKEYFSDVKNLEKHRQKAKTRNNSSFQTDEFKDQARKRMIEYNKSEVKKELNRINQTGKAFTEERKENISKSLKDYHARNNS